MARQLRLAYAGALYHLTARGNARAAIYTDDTDRRTFLQLFGREIEQQGWLCYAYCLMDNHYHLLIETPEPNLSRGMRRLNGVYTQTFNRRHHRVGHVLQGRFKSIVVDKDHYLLELCRYIVLNPVRARMVEAAQDWPWSSYRATAGCTPSPSWLAVTSVLGLFGDDTEAAMTGYRRFVEGGVDQASPWKQLRGQIFLGDNAFLQRMERLARGQRLTNVPTWQSHPTRLGPETVLERVATVYRVDVDALLARSHAQAYQCAAWLLRRVANMPLREVAHLFGVSPSRISHIQQAMESEQPDPRRQEAIQRCKVKQ
jgi:REP element-mobilizing transposase RayT